MCETLDLHSPESNWDVLLLIFQSVSATKRNQVQRGDVQVEGLSSGEMRHRQKADLKERGLELELQPEESLRKKRDKVEPGVR